MPITGCCHLAFPGQCVVITLQLASGVVPGRLASTVSNPLLKIITPHWWCRPQTLLYPFLIHLFPLLCLCLSWCHHVFTAAIICNFMFLVRSFVCIVHSTPHCITYLWLHFMICNEFAIASIIIKKNPCSFWLISFHVMTTILSIVHHILYCGLNIFVKIWFRTIVFRQTAHKDSNFIFVSQSYWYMKRGLFLSWGKLF